MSKARIVKCMKCFKTASDLSRHKAMPRAGQMSMRAAVAHLKAAIGMDETADPGVDPTGTNGNYQGEPNPQASTTPTPKYVTVESLVRAVWAAPFNDKLDPYMDRDKVENNLKTSRAAVITDDVVNEVNARLGAAALVGRHMSESEALGIALETGYRRKEAQERYEQRLRLWDPTKATELDSYAEVRRHEAAHAVFTIGLTGCQVATVKATKDGGATMVAGFNESVDHLGNLAMIVAGMATNHENAAFACDPSQTNGDISRAIKLARQVLVKAGRTSAAGRLNENQPDAVAVGLMAEMVAAVRAVLPKHTRVTDAIGRVAEQLWAKGGQISGADVTNCVNASLQRNEWDSASIVEEKKKFRADVVGALQRALGLPVR